MSRLRFTTAREVVEAFPSAAADIGVELGEAAPLDCLDALAGGEAPDAAIAFCCYLLPRREAVSWGCACLRKLLPELASGSHPTLEAAETWVRRPDDPSRRAALALAMASDAAVPTTWLAFGAGWAGGSMVPGEHAVPAPHHLTAKAVRAAVVLGLGRAAPAARRANIAACVALARRLVDGHRI